MRSQETVSRLNFLPIQLPDETLHSRLSRLHTLSGNLDDRHTLQDAFGSHTLVPTSHLPSHLEALAARLPKQAQVSVTELMEHATLFPYYRPFLRPLQVETCLTAMCSGNAGGMKVAIGLVASRIGGANTFRFCRQCCLHDARHYGTAYWHRAHQLPGVWLCLDHDLPLVDVEPKWLRSHRHNLFLPMQEQFHGDGSEHLISPRHAESLSACATLGVQLLRANQSPLDPDSLRSFYRACAVEQGWIDAHGRIRTQAIRNAAIDIGARMPNDGQFAFMRDEQWIYKLLHRHRGSMHSLKHLTMLAMFDSDWPSLLSYCRSHSCASAPDKQAPPQIGSISDNVCPPAVLRALRPKTLRGEKLERLKVALATTEPLQQVALSQDVSIPSLYRMLRKYPAVAVEREERHRDARRQRFIDASGTVLLRRAQDYMWLYRHDRAWLEKQVAEQPRRTSKPAHPRVDWAQRDQALAQEIACFARDLLKVVPPVRVSKTLIARATGRQAMIEKYAAWLPSVMAELAEVAEGIEHFQCRRLQWAADELHRGGQSAAPWRLLKIAGLKLPLSSAVEQALIHITAQQ